MKSKELKYLDKLDKLDIEILIRVIEARNIFTSERSPEQSRCNYMVHKLENLLK